MFSQHSKYYGKRRGSVPWRSGAKSRK